MGKRNSRAKSPPFVMLPRWVTQSAAWRSLSPPDRAIYLELRERFNGLNNGMIGLGCREAAEAINVGNDTANRSFRKLTELGFVEAATKSAFNRNGRRATEWLLTELPDDRTGHKASKTFMSWRPENLEASPIPRTLSPTSRTQTQNIPGRKALRPIPRTLQPQKAFSASDLKDTYRSTTPPPPQTTEAQLVEEAPPPKGRAHRNEQASGSVSDDPARSGPVHVSSSLMEVLKRASPGSVINGAGRKLPVSPNLGDGERSMLRWLVGFDGPATHRRAQQNLSGQLKGDAISNAANVLAKCNLIRVEENGRRRLYTLLDAGRDPALLHDPDQIDLESWLGATAQ